MSKNRPQAADPYSHNDPFSPRVHVWETVDVEFQDMGANDEGNYYQWCAYCVCRREHDSNGCCIACETA